MLPQRTQSERARRDCKLQSVHSLCVLCVLCGCLINAKPADGALTVVRVDGEPFAAELVSVSNTKAVFRTPSDNGSAGVVSTLVLDDFVRWGHIAKPRPQTIVVLADGGRLITAPDWAGSAAVRLESEALVVRSSTFDEVRLPRQLVHGVVFAQRRNSAQREELEEQMHTVNADAESRDAAWLTNGDRLGGELNELAGGTLTITTAAGAAKLPLSRVEAVVLKRSLAPTADSPSKLVIGLRDGSVLYANAIRADDDELRVELASGTTLIGGTVADVAAIQPLGGRFVYLSDLEPADYRHVPYLDIQWLWQRDRSVTGSPLRVRGDRYLKGIGMHSAARLTCRLAGDYCRFDAAVAVDDTASGRGSVTFGVYLLRNGEWQEAFTSGILRGDDAPQPVSVDLRDAEALTLTVDYADRGDELDRGVWLDARLIDR
jgi:hypothetical protein